jgi:hypothetical protein
MPKHDEATSEPSLPGFINWLESKDPNEHYQWRYSEICACGQYAKHLGKKEWQHTGSIWLTLNSLARGDDLYAELDPKKRTFGQLLDRAKKVKEPA